MRTDEEDNGMVCGGGNAAPPSGSSTSPAGHETDRGDERRRICRCLTECADCECCGEGWVMLGCIELCAGGIIKSSLDREERYCHRKWIKTIECLCRPEKATACHGDDNDQTSAQLTIADEDRELELMRVKDPDIDEKIESIVSNKAHRKLFRAQRIRNLDHFIYVLETRIDDLKALAQFASAPNKPKLGQYLAAARTWKGNEPMSEG